MDAVVASLAALSGDEQLKEAAVLLRTHDVEELLNNINPAGSTIAYLYLLPHSQAEPDVVIHRCKRVIAEGDERQIKTVPGEFAAVCNLLLSKLLASQNSISGIRYFVRAIKIIRPSPEHLTPMHPQLLLLCLKNKCYHIAKEILKDVIYDVSPEQTRVTPLDLLLYSYYGGLALVGLKEYQRAIDFFQMGFTAPAVSLSAVMLECYNKYILVSLIHQGKVDPNPPYSTPIFLRHFEAGSHVYREFAEVFGTHDVNRVRQFIETHHEFFLTQKTLGLAKQALTALYKQKIQQHTQTFLTLTLRDMAESVHLSSADEAEHLVLGMVEDGLVQAKINQLDGMVSFQGEGSSTEFSPALVDHLNAQIRETMSLTMKLRSIDESIILSTTTHKKAAHGGGPTRITSKELEEYGGMDTWDPSDTA